MWNTIVAEQKERKKSPHNIKGVARDRESAPSEGRSASYYRSWAHSSWWSVQSSVDCKTECPFRQTILRKLVFHLALMQRLARARSLCT